MTPQLISKRKYNAFSNTTIIFDFYYNVNYKIWCILFDSNPPSKHWLTRNNPSFFKLSGNNGRICFHFLFLANSNSRRYILFYQTLRFLLGKQLNQSKPFLHFALLVWHKFIWQYKFRIISYSRVRILI